MEHNRVVITGVGVVSAIGTGKDAFWEGLRVGRSGIKQITLFDTKEIRSKKAGEISNFKPEEILGRKGLRLLDRTTKLALCASKLALCDSRFEVNDGNAGTIGVTLGTTLGSFSSRGDFSVKIIKEGPRSVNPALFPNTVINSPASQISIWFGIKGFNTTISTGFTSSLEAFEYAANFIMLGRSQAVLVGGVEELCKYTYIGFYNTGFLSGSAENTEELSAPFDIRRNGAVLGEGSVMFLLEDYKHAKARGAHIYAEYMGGASVTDLRAYNRYNLRAAGAKKAIEQALRNAGVRNDDIDYAASGANSTLIGDASEVRALQEVFGKEIIASASKSMIGETFSASGAFQIASALLSFEKNVIPPTINFETADKRCMIDCAANTARKKDVSCILVSSVSPMCRNSGCVLARGDRR